VNKHKQTECTNTHKHTYKHTHTKHSHTHTHALLSLLPLSHAHVAPTHCTSIFFVGAHSLVQELEHKIFSFFFLSSAKDFSHYNFCFLGAHARAEVLPTPRPNFRLRYFFVCDGYTHAQAHTHSLTDDLPEFPPQVCARSFCTLRYV
jgi:hypothetical protein